MKEECDNLSINCAFVGSLHKIKKKFTEILSITFGEGTSRTKVSILTEQRNFSLTYSVQTGSVTHPPSCSMGTGGSIALGKAAGE